MQQMATVVKEPTDGGNATCTTEEDRLLVEDMPIMTGDEAAVGAKKQVMSSVVEVEIMGSSTMQQLATVVEQFIDGGISTSTTEDEGLDGGGSNLLRKRGRDRKKKYEVKPNKSILRG